MKKIEIKTNNLTFVMKSQTKQVLKNRSKIKNINKLTHLFEIALNQEIEYNIQGEFYI